jgi:hypothetical protein
MTTNPPTLVGQPQLKYMLDAHARQLSRDINCMLPAQIVSFDAAANTATVKLMVKRQLVDGTTITFPPIVDCPVVVMRGGGAWLEFPIAAGDDCIVLFADRSIDNWFTAGDVAVPDMSRAHAFSDAVVLIGVSPSPRALALTGDHVGLHAEGHKLILDNDDCSVSLDAGVKVDAQAKKVSVKNNAKNLKAILEAMLDAMIGATGTIAGTVGPAPTVTGTCAITTNVNIAAIKTQIALLLED